MLNRLMASSKKEIISRRVEDIIYAVTAHISYREGGRREGGEGVGGWGGLRERVERGLNAILGLDLHT